MVAPKLALLFLLYYWVFVVVYAPMVVLPAWAVPPATAPVPGPRWLRIAGGLLPLLPLLPYGLVAWMVFG